ncbi:hypothetical protein BH23ACT10_BH23ACT10_19730 [soil metagenome]
MSDTVDPDALYRLAESQAGYFTTHQAERIGMHRSTLRHHARPNGRYQRARRGLYRLRHFPSSPHEHVVAAWLPLEGTGALVSHDSALELYELSDTIPDAVHISIPRTTRGRRPRSGVRFHTMEHPPTSNEIRIVHGLPVTTPERTIVDAFEAGSQVEQVEMAVRQALDRGLTTRRRLRSAGSTRSRRVQAFIERSLMEPAE